MAGQVTLQVRGVDLTTTVCEAEEIRRRIIGRWAVEVRGC